MTTRTTEKRQYVNLLRWAAAILILLALMPQRAEAANKYIAKITTLKQNTWATQKDNPWVFDSNGNSTHTDHYWKISVPANGYLKIQVKSKKSGKPLSIYKKVKTTATQSTSSNQFRDYVTRHSDSTGSIRQVLKKGTYYLQGYGGEQYRWSFIKIKNPNTLNYCRSRAKAVKSGVKQSILFNHGYEYSRWFKVVLPKKKTITITLEKLDKDSDFDNNYDAFTVYKANGGSVSCPSLTDKTYRTPILPKGTYYVRIRHDSYNNYEMWSGRLFSFFWK